MVINALFADYDFSDINLSDTALESSMNALLAVPAIAAKIDPINNSVISAADAVAKMKTYLTENSLQYDKKFTQEYLNGKTFYVVELWDSGWASMSDTFNSNGTVSYVDSPDGNFTEPYEVTADGKIKVTDDPGSSFNWIIKTITDDYIEVSYGLGIDDVAYFYFDKAKADAKLASLQRATVSVAGGFGAEWLEGRVLYLVIVDTQDDDKDGSRTDWLIVGFKYENGNIFLDFSADGSYESTTGMTYSIVNGALVTTEDDYEFIDTIIAVDATKITLGDSDETGDAPYMFFSKADAQAYINTLP